MNYISRLSANIQQIPHAGRCGYATGTLLAFKRAGNLLRATDPVGGLRLDRCVARLCRGGILILRRAKVERAIGHRCIAVLGGQVNHGGFPLDESHKF